MTRLLRPPMRCTLLAVLLLSICTGMGGQLVGRAWAGERAHMTPEMLDDAQLNDVYFLDSDHGWAVGDRGLVLHTEDGGRQWWVQRSGTTCALESVHFVDAQNGWAVGGQVQPYTHRSACVVARTEDGGRTWTIVPDLTLPALKRVQFHNARQGWAVGNRSALYPTGVFRSEDGGRSWVPVPGGMAGQWLAGYFLDSTRGIIAGRDGALAVISVPQVVASRTPDLGRRPLRDISLGKANRGWLVGDGGLVMETSDGGLTWQTPEGQLPDGMTELMDWQAVATVGDDVWMVGAPGTLVLHSADGGRTWELLRTDQALPLRAVTFVDRDRGWAVGALGTILATRDGGRTWRRQRSGGTRVALLGIFSEAERVPLELFTLQSGDEGYLGYAEILNRRDVELPAPGDASLEDKAFAALSAVGASGAGQAWRFPLRQQGLLLSAPGVMDIWDRVNDGRGVARLEELVVRRIRQWRAEVVVTEAARPRGDQPLSHLINQIVLSAVQKAADPTAYPEHGMLVGLEPWTVKKVLSVAPEDDQPTLRLTTAQLATRLGRSLAEHAADGYALVRPAYVASPVTMGFRLLHDGLPQAAGRSDVFSGIYLAPGGDARRRTSQPAARDLEILAQAAQKRRNLEQLLELTPEKNVGATAWLGQVEDLTTSLSPLSAGQVLFQLAQRYRQSGQPDLAAQTLELLVERYPQHVLAEETLVWLVTYYASSEAAWQLRRETRFERGVAQAAVVGARVEQSVGHVSYQQDTTTPSDVVAQAHAGAFPGLPQADMLAQPAQVGAIESAMRSASRSTTAGALMDATDRAERALHFASLIQQARPPLFAEPRVQFPMAVAYRRRGMERDSQRLYHRLGAAPLPSAWQLNAQAELWLAHGQGVCPKTTYICRRVASRPRLDGQLDDAAWQNAEHVELSSTQRDDGQWPAAAMLAYDDEFLFVAANCRRVPQRVYPETDGPRPRDADLADRDRIVLCLDLDRDYTSFYQLTIDHRGWTGEACIGDVSWNPTWYVAAAGTDADWTIELAIPLDELLAIRPAKQDVWALGLQRVVPDVGVQGLTHPASVTPRGEAFAFMVFQ